MNLTSQFYPRMLSSSHFKQTVLITMIWQIVYWFESINLNQSIYKLWEWFVVHYQIYTFIDFTVISHITNRRVNIFTKISSWKLHIFHSQPADDPLPLTILFGHCCLTRLCKMTHMHVQCHDLTIATCCMLMLRHTFSSTFRTSLAPPWQLYQVAPISVLAVAITEMYSYCPAATGSSEDRL